MSRHEPCFGRNFHVHINASMINKLKVKARNSMSHSAATSISHCTTLVIKQKAKKNTFNLDLPNMVREQDSS